MIKLSALFITLLISIQSIGQTLSFVPYKNVHSAAQGGILFIYHPQMMETHTHRLYDISGNSDLRGTCKALDFYWGSVGAEYFSARTPQSVIINKNGDVTGLTSGGPSFKSIGCLVH